MSLLLSGSQARLLAESVHKRPHGQVEWTNTIAREWGLPIGVKTITAVLVVTLASEAWDVVEKKQSPRHPKILDGAAQGARSSRSCHPRRDRRRGGSHHGCCCPPALPHTLVQYWARMRLLGWRHCFARSYGRHPHDGSGVTLNEVVKSVFGGGPADSGLARHADCAQSTLGRIRAGFEKRAGAQLFSHDQRLPECWKTAPIMHARMGSQPGLPTSHCLKRFFRSRSSMAMATTRRISRTANTHQIAIEPRCSWGLRLPR